MKRIYIAVVIFLIFISAIVAAWLYIPRPGEEDGGKMGAFCRMSGGTFVNGECTCPSVLHIGTQLFYNEETGFCETEFGVPYFGDEATLSG